MRRVVVTGKNVEEALDNGIKKLNTVRDKVEYNVLAEAEKGFLGFFGGKKAEVEVIKKVDKIKQAKIFLEDLINNMNLYVKVEIKKKTKNELIVNLTGDDLGIAIGRHGETLDSIQYLTNLAVNKGNQDYLRVILDADGYRNRRRKTLEKLAKKMAKKAKRKNRKVMLEPMPPHERRVIHTTLQNYEKISTYSEGQDPYRKVVIVAK